MNATGSRTSDYDFDLPADRIAQRPADRRDASRLMIVDRATGRLEHGVFADLGDRIPAGDILVANRSRVFRARLLGVRDSGAPAEVMLLRRREGDVFEAMVSPGSKLKPRRVVTFAPDFRAEILETTGRGTRLVRLTVDGGAAAAGAVAARGAMAADSAMAARGAAMADGAVAGADAVAAAIERYGHVPLPPYIDRSDESADAERYQTVFAREPGSVAAPTAGLHFTRELLERLDARGVKRAEVVLHVGAGTFKPVEVDDPAEHVMHEEVFAVSDADAAAINATRDAGGKSWAVGTTTVRTLESIADDGGHVRPGEGETRIFIRPPYRFKAVDHLITNFHLPRSTLLMLVAAFAGYDLTMQAYREAIAKGYRFYSYGDAMLIL